MAEGKAPLDRDRRYDDKARAAAYVKLAREGAAESAPVGEKEMAMTRRPRGEDAALRADRFARIERGESES